jgi:class 3 adenylate cyclase
MDKPDRTQHLKLSSQSGTIETLMAALAAEKGQDAIEALLSQTFRQAPHDLVPDADGSYYSILNYCLYRYILKHYKDGENNICLWRYIKTLSKDQLHYQQPGSPELSMLDHLVRIYFYSDPLDDLTCIFVPLGDAALIKAYLNWIKSYFYEANYPTSLLWLYALDSSLASLFPDEIVYIGKRAAHDDGSILIPDFNYKQTVLLKRFSDKPGHYIKLEGEEANSEFRQVFSFLQREFKDRCLSRSGQHDDEKEWKKFEDVLRFGVADDDEHGCTSFSDLRFSTEFLNAYKKNIYLNRVQQPFFEKTGLIWQRYNGRIDKFMGDNVMCVFLNKNMNGASREERETEAILNNFFALFALCKVMSEIIEEHGYEESKLGLRSGVTYGTLLRSNLGNEILRDFTVTGETVNLAARLEHISISELVANNQAYFGKAIERYPQISELMSISENYKNLNPETKTIIENFTLYQNILSNLEKLEKARYDIRFNQRFYFKLREHLHKKGYALQSLQPPEIYGYEEYIVEGFSLKFYFSYYNPKGFSVYKRIWLLPLERETLAHLDIEKIR